MAGRSGFRLAAGRDVDDGCFEELLTDALAEAGVAMGATVGDGGEAAELVGAVDVGGAFAEPDGEKVEAKFDRVAAGGPGEVVDDLDAAFTGDAGAVGVAVEGADAADVDGGREFVRDAVGDAALAVEEAQFIDEAGIQEGDVLDGEAVGILIEAGERFEADEAVATGLVMAVSKLLMIAQVE